MANVRHNLGLGVALGHAEFPDFELRLPLQGDATNKTAPI